MQRLVNFLKNSKGATAIEYALIAGLIAVALAATFTSFKGSINNKFNSVGTSLTNA
jgi:pilus assembly protein Flp/PilA